MRVWSVGSRASPNASFSATSANSSCKLTILTDLGVGFLPPYWPNCMPSSVGVGGESRIPPRMDDCNVDAGAGGGGRLGSQVGYPSESLDRRPEASCSWL